MSARIDVVNSPRDQRLKSAFRDLVAACGGQDGAAMTTGRSQQRISLYGHPNSDAFPPLDVIAALEAASHGTPGHPHVTRMLAREDGCELFKLPGSGLPESVWSGHCGALAKEGGEVMSSICSALADDNDVSPVEARRAIVEVDELIAVAVKLRAALSNRAEEVK